MCVCVCVKMLLDHPLTWSKSFTSVYYGLIDHLNLFELPMLLHRSPLGHAFAGSLQSEISMTTFSKPLALAIAQATLIDHASAAIADDTLILP